MHINRIRKVFENNTPRIDYGLGRIFVRAVTCAPPTDREIFIWFPKGFEKLGRRFYVHRE